MKKLMTFALCFAAIGSMSAQKANVEAAKKLSGKPEKIEEARSLINEAMQNPETANDAQTYFIAGKIEFDAFDKDLTNSMINPASVDNLKMGQNLLNGYNNYVKALPLASVPNEKGKVDTKTPKAIVSALKGHANDYFKAGADFFNGQKVYPEAYECFMIYADMPDQEFMQGEKLELPDTDRGTAYFNAGLAAYSGNEIYKSADAFRKARGVGYDDKQAYIYEIACWQAAAQRDSTMVQTAQEKIMEVADAGYQKYGMEEPLFINNIVNFLVADEKYDQAVSKVNELIASNPDNAGLYGLRGFVYDRMNKDEESVNDYRKAASLDNVDFETLKNAGKKIYRVGADKYNSIEGNSEADRAARLDVKTNYFEAAKSIANKAKAMNSNDGDLDYLIESIDYALTTFFN
ncbi:MAG: hypothetical protein K2K75_13755 [Muribaculaceae bacterium]|nr:hypothetical protein [Muribaculaceae bacterium]